MPDVIAAPVAPAPAAAPEPVAAPAEPTQTDSTSSDGQSVDDIVKAELGRDSSAPVAPVPEPKAPEPLDDETKEFFEILKGEEIPAPAGREGWTQRVALSKAKKLVAAAIKRAKDANEAIVKGHTDKISGYETQLENIGRVEQVMFGDQKRFLQILKTIPGYAELLAPLDAPPKPAEPASEDVEPQPDYKLPDGSMTYSLEGIRKRDAWRDRQLKKQFDERLDPLVKTHEQQTAAAKLDHEIRTVHLPRVEAIIADARKTWPGFAQNEKEIEGLVVGQGMSLEAAYRSVVVPKLAVDETKMREKLLAEINAQPHSTATVAAASTKPDAAGDDLDSIIMQELKR